ncbi:MAG: putative immunity protein [Chloroflexota bacterium]
MILPKKRDPRFITVRRGGALQDADHHLLAIWAADCAQHVLHLFEEMQPNDDRPRRAIGSVRAWARGEITMSRSRAAGGHAMAAARDLSGAARYAAGQAAVVAHVAAHELGAAAYAIRAARAAAPEGAAESAGRLECRWQRDQLPDAIRDLVLDDQKLRNEICWFVFGC